MYLSEFLTEITITNSKNVATPIEISYYDDYSWEQTKPYNGYFFASLDFAFVDSADFIDGEVMELEVTELGLEIHVVTA